MAGRKKLESEFATDLDKKLKARLGDHFSYKLDPNQVQGIPDRLILSGPNWAILETKRGTSGADAHKQPNQDHYVEKFAGMGFSAFINPQNCDEVLDEMEAAWRARG